MDDAHVAEFGSESVNGFDEDSRSIGSDAGSIDGDGVSVGEEYFSMDDGGRKTVGRENDCGEAGPWRSDLRLEEKMRTPLLCRICKANGNKK